LAQASAGKACRVNFIDGTHWFYETNGLRLQLCYSDSLSAPLDMVVENHSKREVTHIVFENFNPAKPDPSVFEVPSYCPTN